MKLNGIAAKGFQDCMTKDLVAIDRMTIAENYLNLMCKKERKKDRKKALKELQLKAMTK